MRSRVLSDGDERTLVAVFDTGDEVVSGLEQRAHPETNLPLLEP